MFMAPALRAFEVEYAGLFKITDVQLVDGTPVLPLSKGKYADIRVLDKETFDFLKTCANGCKQSAQESGVAISSIRRAQTRENMWISEVEVDKKWLLVCLVFRNERKLSVVFPPNIVVLKKAWRAQVEEILARAIEAN